eukprot:COSAG01_NODE_48932_length_376_cov_3.176895_1_plen_27_part_01
MHAMHDAQQAVPSAPLLPQSSSSQFGE